MTSRCAAPGSIVARRTVFVSGVLCAATACADIQHVSAPAVQLVEELRLDPHVEDFSVVRNVHVGPRGQMVVPQPQDRQLWLYDSTGRRLATIGRQGSGPGEFEAMNLAGWAAETLWVFDGRQYRVTWVAPDGTVLRTSPLPPTLVSGAAVDGETGTVLFFSPRIVRPDGAMFGEARLRGESGLDAGWPERVLLFALPDVPARVVARPPAYEDERWFMTVSGFGRNVPFAAQPLLAFSPNGSRFAYLTTQVDGSEGGNFTVTMFELPGDTAFVRSYPFRGFPVTTAERDSALAAMEPRPGAPREGPADLPQRFQAAARDRMPPVHPPVVAMILGLDETIWLTLRDTADTRMALVLDGDGEPIASLRLPSRSTIRQASATHLWLTQTDDVDLTTVLRVRVVPGGSEVGY